MIYLVAFLLSFTFVFLRAFQQQNVQYKRKALVMPVSYGMACTEMFNTGLFVTTFIDQGMGAAFILALIIGTGGGIGCIISMSCHEWLTKRIYHWDKKEKA
jgi:hypothetical protein